MKVRAFKKWERYKVRTAKKQKCLGFIWSVRNRSLTVAIFLVSWERHYAKDGNLNSPARMRARKLSTYRFYFVIFFCQWFPVNILSIRGFGLGILGNTKYMSYPFRIVQGFLKSDFSKDFYNDDLRKQTFSLTMWLKDP